MTNPIQSDTEALTVAALIITAQDGMLVAYRFGTRRTPAGHIDTLAKHRPRLTEYLEHRHITGAEL